MDKYTGEGIAKVLDILNKIKISLKDDIVYNTGSEWDVPQYTANHILKMSVKIIDEIFIEMMNSAQLELNNIVDDRDMSRQVCEKIRNIYWDKIKQKKGDTWFLGSKKL